MRRHYLAAGLAVLSLAIAPSFALANGPEVPPFPPGEESPDLPPFPPGEESPDSPPAPPGEESP